MAVLFSYEYYTDIPPLSQILQIRQEVKGSKEAKGSHAVFNVSFDGMAMALSARRHLSHRTRPG